MRRRLDSDGGKVDHVGRRVGPAPAAGRLAAARDRVAALRGLRLPNPLARHLPRRIGLKLALALGLGGLTLLGVGSVLLVSVSGAGRITTSLVRDKADLILSSIEQRVRSHLEPAAAQAAYIRAMIERGELDPRDDAAIGRVLFAALAATPQVRGVAFLRADGHVVRVGRDDSTPIAENWAGRPEITAVIASMRPGDPPRWGAPVWSEPFERTILTLTDPVFRDGRLVGVVVPAILISELSRFVAEFSTREQTAFILFGRDRVIAHPKLATGEVKASREAPLPAIDGVGDPALADIWNREGELGFRLKPGDSGHIARSAGDYTILISRRVTGYGPEPWMVGAAMPGRDAGQEFASLMKVALIGSGLLLVSVIGALYAAARLARPIGDIVRLTEAVQRLDLEDAPTLPRSRIRELDQAGQALNGMVAALRWFELYLPRRVVRALLARGGEVMVQAREREVSVLFTDICGFSRLAARMSPAETGAFLNEHFSLVGRQVEAEGGTIDKYIGDSVMAFWGAPDEQEDHADRACRAALAIAAAIRSDNGERRAQGLEPVRIRVGVGTGRVLVGNIGASGRVNYTLVGDVVNLAQRVEQLGKEVGPDEEAIVLVTEESHARLAERPEAVLVARRELGDREGLVGVFRLS